MVGYEESIPCSIRHYKVDETLEKQSIPDGALTDSWRYHDKTYIEKYNSACDNLLSTPAFVEDQIVWLVEEVKRERKEKDKAKFRAFVAFFLVLIVVSVLIMTLFD